MAKTVKEFSHWHGNRPEGNYPWDEWLNGEVWVLTEEDLRKQDFVDMARYIHKVAKMRGLSCRTKRWDWDPRSQTYNSLYVQAWKEDKNAKKSSKTSR
tara:strand:+ start:80 stop:373 length:294 start_codon:yes stop_codon:yes gene_type:complete